MSVEYKRVLLSELHEDPANARVHPDENLADIRASLREFGQVEPLVVQKASGKVIGGNGRIKVMRELGWTECDVAYVEFDNMKSTALGIALNRAGERATWDVETLEKLMAEIGDVDAELAQSFKELEESVGIEEPIGEADAEPQIDRAAELQKKWQTAQGQLWLIGEHRLLCGDSTKREDVERVMGGERARYGMFDPPYGIDVIGGVSKAKANVYEPIQGDDKPFDPTPFKEYADECVWWGANYYADKLPSMKGWIVWDKKGREWEDNFSDCEMAWTPFKTVARIYRHVWMGLVQEHERETRVHPTQKPAKLFEKLIADLFIELGIILDLWAGSGTTFVAAQNLNRICYGIEISPAYCAVILERMKTAFPQLEIRQA